MERINVLGKGFVGGRFVDMTPNVFVNQRNDYTVKPGTKEVVYFISTIDNYNVHSDPFLDINTNLITLIKTLESCKDKDITFNFISSWFVYGDVPLPAREDAHCDPKGFYSITKRAAEQLLISYCETFDINYRIIRLANVLGITDNKVSKKKNALQYMINEIKEGRDVNLYNNGEIYRDYIHVDDVVKAINLIIESGNKNDIYNVGNGEKVYLIDVLSKVKEMTNSSSKLIGIEPAPFHTKVQTKNMVLNINKIKELGYIPDFTMTEILESLL